MITTVFEITFMLNVELSRSRRRLDHEPQQQRISPGYRKQKGRRLSAPGIS